jgi:membrane associated rhomboid family serine protease
MFKSIIDDIKYSYRTGNMITRLIIINVAIFLVMALLKAFFPSFYPTFESFLAIPGSPIELLTKPWTVITHMFIHSGFFHMGWNMLFLYWFGRITGDLLGDHRVLPLYILGGLAGALAYFLSYQLFPDVIGSRALGASAAVMAIIATAGATAPDYVMRLILIGDVRLKYIVFFIIFMDIIGTAGQTNTGGHIAHLAGAAFGLLFVFQLRQGLDLVEPMGNFILKISNWFSGKNQSSKAKKSSPLSVKYKSRKKSSDNKKGSASSDVSFQEKLDAILDKIKENGYDSLTSEEKEFLFQASKK